MISIKFASINILLGLLGSLLCPFVLVSIIMIFFLWYFIPFSCFWVLRREGEIERPRIDSTRIKRTHTSAIQKPDKLST